MGDDDGGGGEPNVGEDGPPYFPYAFPYRNIETIPHYYGDYVRSVFVVIGALMLILAPIFSNSAPQLLPFQIGGAIILVFLAGLTSPKKQWVMILNACAAAAGIVVFESVALAAYDAGAWISFIALEVVTISFLVALYFSVKTVRAMFQGKIGKRSTFGEFADNTE